MTRKEIVKALRCFASEDYCPFDECNEKCPYWMEIDKYDIDNPNAEISDVHQLCCAAADLLEQDAKKTNWISVKDRLPEKSGHYLICTSINYWHGGCWDTNSSDGTTKGYDDTTMSVLDCYIDCTHDWNRVCNCHVTHWMPLPEPPKEETK